METTRRTAARIARLAVAKNDRVDTALFFAFLPLAIIGSVVPWVLAASIPFGVAWAIRGAVENRRVTLADKTRVREYEERLRATYGPTYTH